MSIGLLMLRDVPLGICTVEHEELSTAETKAGPSSPSLALSVQLAREVSEAAEVAVTSAKAIAGIFVRILE